MVARIRSNTSGLISLFVRHRNAANLVMVLMIIFGTIALSRINTQFFPKIEIPVITVTVDCTQTSCGYSVPVFEYVGDRSKEQRGRRYKGPSRTSAPPTAPG